MLGRGKQIAKVGCGAVNRSGIDHQRRAIRQDEQRTVPTIRRDLVNFKDARLPGGEELQRKALRLAQAVRLSIPMQSEQANAAGNGGVEA